MKNETNLFKRIRNIIVGNTLPKNEDLWIDTSNGEKQAVLKYKGNPLVGSGGGGDKTNSNIPTLEGEIIFENGVNQRYVIIDLMDWVNANRPTAFTVKALNPNNEEEQFFFISVSGIILTLSVSGVQENPGDYWTRGEYIGNDKQKYLYYSSSKQPEPWTNANNN